MSDMSGVERELALELAHVKMQLDLLDSAMRRAIRLLRQVDKKYQDTTLEFCATLMNDCLRGAGLTPEMAPTEPKDAA